MLPKRKTEGAVLEKWEREEKLTNIVSRDC